MKKREKVFTVLKTFPQTREILGCLAVTAAVQNENFQLQRMTSQGLPVFFAYWMTERVPFELPSQKARTLSA